MKNYKKGDRVKYPVIDLNGNVTRYIETKINRVSDGNFPIIYLENNHESQYNGIDFVVDGLQVNMTKV